MAEHLRTKHIRVELRVRRIARMQKAIELEENGSIGRQLIGPTENGPKVLLVAGQTHAHEAKEDVAYARFHLPLHLNHLDAQFEIVAIAFQTPANVVQTLLMDVDDLSFDFFQRLFQ